MRSNTLIALGFGAAAVACTAGAAMLRDSSTAFWIAVVAAVLMGLNAALFAYASWHCGRSRVKASVLEVSKAPFEHEPEVRGKSPPPVQ